MRLYADGGEQAHAVPFSELFGFVLFVVGVADGFELVGSARAEVVEGHADAADGKAEKVVYALLFFRHRRPPVRSARR